MEGRGAWGGGWGRGEGRLYAHATRKLGKMGNGMRPFRLRDTKQVQETIRRLVGPTRHKWQSRKGTSATERRGEVRPVVVGVGRCGGGDGGVAWRVILCSVRKIERAEKKKK